MKRKLQMPKKILSVLLCALVLFSCVPMSVISASAESASDITVAIDTGAEVTLKDTDADNYYEIGTADELYAFAYAVNGGNYSINGELTANIVVNEGTMTAETDSTTVRHWTPIGNYGRNYTGNFYGADYTISGLYFNNEEVTYVGLVGCLGTGALVDYVGIENSYFNGCYYVGAVVGRNYGTLTNSYNTGTVSGSACVGGVVGLNDSSTITNSYYLNTSYNGGIDGADVAGSAEAKTAEQFASGEVAYLLQGNQTEEIWGQKIGTDEQPSLNGDKVYAVNNCSGVFDKYSNSIETTHNFNNTHVCKDCYTLEENQIAGVAGYSLSLGGNIALSYHMVLDESVIADENAKLVFTVPNGDETKTVECFVKNATKNGDFYVFTCEVPAKEMASNITCKVVSGNSVSSTFTYSVKQYADIILANPDKYEKEIPLVKAMLNYGAYTQKYFGYNTANLANANLSDDDKALTDVDLSKYDYTVTGNQEGVRLYGATLSLKSETAINLYFKISDEIDVEALDITVNGKPVQIENIGEYSIINIPNIPAQNLGDMYEVKIGNLTVNCSVFSYGNTAMSTDKEILKNTIKALYAYNQVAVEYTK